MQSIQTLSIDLWVRASTLDERRLRQWRPLLLLLAILVIWLLSTHCAWADPSSSSGSTTSGSTSSSGGNPWGTASDPWGSSVGKLAGMLNGAVAKGIGTIALFAAGGMLVFGGELNEFTKKICMVVVAVSVMILGGGMIGTIFGV